MSQEKYIGMDVHQATISVAVVDWQGVSMFVRPAGQRSTARLHSALSIWLAHFRNYRPPRFAAKLAESGI